MKRISALLVALTLPLGCKTTEPDASSQVKDFDTGANPELTIAFDGQFGFCPNAPKFNIVNAYWLTLASAYVYATKDRVTEVAAGLQQQMGEAPLKVDFLASKDSANPLDPSTQALWIETNDVAILAFRGTPLDRFDVQDVVSDAKALPVAFPGGGKVHKGFLKGLDSVWDQVQSRLASLKGTDKSLFITGHSLGAAIATLAAARITMTPALAEVRPNLHGLYTIGSPMVGNLDFAKKFTAAVGEQPFPVVRIRNHNDIVTRTPGAIYQHVGSSFYLTDDGRLYSDDPALGLARYKLPATLAIANGFTPTQLKDLSEHLPPNYFQKIASEYTSHKVWTKSNTADACGDTAFYQMAQVEDKGAAPGINRLEDLKGLKNQQLTLVFAKGTAEPIPSAALPGTEADGQGLPIIFAGNLKLNDFAFNFWEGKIFRTDEAGRTTLTNKLAGNLLQDITAEVVKVPEGLGSDKSPSILLNYGASNRLAARAIRDEIRLIAPNLYLGRANLEQPKLLWPILGRYQFVCWFALQFSE